MLKHQPQIMQPINHIDEYAILDFNAVLRHAHGMGRDPDAVYGSATGREINTAEHTVRAFIDAYLIPIIDSGIAPRQILVAHDDGHAYRTKLLPEYKAKRDSRKNDPEKTDVELFEEVKKAEKEIKLLLAYLGATQAQVKGVEGDDIVAYFCELPGIKHVYTVDADLLRLASDDTMIIMKNNPVYINDLSIEDLPKNMHKFFEPISGVEDFNPFTLLTLYKSLVGDSSDEYKGVPQFGEKAWADAVEAFDIDGLQELETIVQNKDWAQLKEVLEYYEEEHPNTKGHKLIAKIYEHRNAWRICYVVADLHPELCWKPYNKKITEINWFKRVPNGKIVKQILDRNYCADFEDELLPLTMTEWLVDADNFEEADIEEFAEICANSPHVSFDYEGFAEPDENLMKAGGKYFVDVLGQQMTGCSFNFGNNLQYTMYVTVDHKDSANLPMDVVKRFLEAIPPEKIKVAHNSVFEEVVNATNLEYSLPVGTVFDTSVMSVYQNENRESHGLKFLSKELLNYDQASYEDTLKQANASNMKELTADQVLQYGLDDSTVTGHLFDLISLGLKLEKTWDFYRKHEPYVNHRFAMSFVQGTDIDFERLEELSKEDQVDVVSLMNEIRAILEEKCTRPNRKAVDAYVEVERKWIEASTRDKLSNMDDDKVIAKAESVAEAIEKMHMAPDELIEVGNRIRAKIPFASGKKAKEARDLSGVDPKVLIAWIIKYTMYEFRRKALEGSVYVKYEEKYLTPAVAPTAKNLDAVAIAVGLEPPGTAAKGKLAAWEANIRQVDFETETDKFDELTDDQKEFLTLLSGAIPHFATDKRGHEDYIKFQNFCSDMLGVEGKTEYTGTELNSGSSAQMKHFLYCMLGLPVRLFGKTSPTRQKLGFWEGSPATDSLAIDTALSEDISIDPELEWQGEVLTKLKRVTECKTRTSLYHNSYPYFKHPRDGKLHPGLRNCGTVTHRPTGGKPNILQVSKHQKKGVMRSIYIPPRGYAVLPIDFAGQELRIQASETRDPNLLSVYLGADLTNQYLSGEVLDITYDMVKDKTDLKDLHGLTASSITQYFGLDEAGELIAGGTPTVKWSPETYEDYMEAFKDEDHEYHKLAGKVRKRPAKATNFLLSYGGGEDTLSHRLIIPKAVAGDIMESTLDLYSGIVKTQEATLKFVRENGFAQTVFGTRRHATNDIFSKSKGPVNRVLRQSYNFRIQGCAANILKVVLQQCELKDMWNRYNAIMLAPVYDEVVAYVPFEHCWDFVQELRGIMNLTPPGHAVPMVADVSVGPNWQVQYELGDQPTREEFEACMQEKVIPEANAIWDRIEGISEAA